MTLLGGGVAALFGEILAPVFLPAVLTTQEATYAPGGRLQRTPTLYSCRAQVDRCTERMVAADGYTTTDRAIYILASGLEAKVETGHLIEISEGPYAGSHWRLASPIERDAAAAYWLCRGVEEKQADG